MTRVKFRTFLVAALFAVLLTVANDGLPAAAAGGLVNPGFESGTLDGSPVGWDIQQPTADAVRVVNTEDFNEFPTYADMGNVTVSPYKGDLMLRLGTPQRLDQNQNRGDSTVTQTYDSINPNLKIAFRVFSWEHRGQDLVKIDVQDPSIPGPNKSVGDLLAPLQIKTSGGPVIATCADIPCQFSLDAGNQGEFVNSGWLVLQIVNLPSDGRNLELTYQVSGTKDASKSTWAYFDNVNTPPVAKFTFAPNNPEEGDVVQFTDLSYDPDPGDAIQSWAWTIDGSDFSLQHPFYVFADEGPYNATLTVCDGEDCSTITDGGIANDGDPVPPLMVANADPLVEALDLEALSGVPALQVGRFVDGGFDDTHTASFSNGAPVTQEEEHDPLLATGLALAPITATSGGTHTLTVDDNDGGSGSASFDITVLQNVNPETWREQENDTLDDPTDPPPMLNAGGSYISFLQEAGDIELFEVRRADGSMLGEGDEVLVNLIDPPGDYDLTLLRVPADGASPGLIGESALPRAGFTDFEVDTQSYAQLGFKGIGFKGIGFKGIGFKGIGFKGIGFKGIGFKGIGFKGIGFKGIGAEVMATDMSLPELGLASIGGTGVQVADFSASRGLGSETVYGVSAAENTRFFVAVTGHQGAHSLSPMSISVETQEQPDLQALLGTDCQGTPIVTSAAPKTVLYEYDDDNNPNTPAPPAETLLVVQWERLAAVNGLDPAGQQDLLNNYLIPLAQHSTVKGTIVSVASDIYNTPDTHRCNVDAVNSVTTQIRQVIRDSAYASVDNVVLVGGDDVIPFRRVLDEGAIANESEYLADSFLKPGSKLYASLALGYVLEDNFYVDDAPDAVGFDIPERAIGRLVESDDDIKAQVTAYLASNGVLEPSTGFVSGFDFFSDGSNAIADELDDALSGTVERLVNESWTAAELRCQFLGQGTGPGCATPDVNSPNAHYTHYLAPSAFGYNNDDPNDRLTNAEVGAAQASAPGRVVFSMGCHAGFNVPDADSQTDGGLGVTPGYDFPQAYRAAVYVANTGYGLGDDAGVGGAEELMRAFAQKLLQGDMNAGQALTDAKSEYINSLLTVTDYDVKTALQATLYGMPTYSVTPAAAPATATAMTLQQVPVVEKFSLTVDDSLGDPIAEAAYNYVEVPTDTGTYFALDDPATAEIETEAQSTPGRAVQPRASVLLELPQPYNGLLLTGGTYTDIPNFNPNIANIQNDWVSSGEPQICQTGFWPAEQAAVNGDTLVVVPGQFRCVPAPASEVTGVEKLWSSQTYEIKSCQSSDGRAPDVQSVDLRPGLVTVNASDHPDGIEQISVLLLANGQIQRVVLPVSASDKYNESFNVPVPDLTPDTEVIVQVLSRGCSVTTWTAKGALLNYIPVDADADRVVIPAQTVTMSATVANFTSLAKPVTFLWDFGDGTFQDGILAPAELATVPVTVDPLTGIATFTVQHTYATLPRTATVRIYDQAGGTGADDVRFLCDPIGDGDGRNGDWVGCGSSNTSTTMTISVAVDGAITDQFQYRVYIDVGKYNTKKKRWELSPDGIFDAQLKYNAGQVTGLNSLTYQVIGNELRFTFDLAEFGLSSGKEVRWYAETQAGVPGVPSTGKVDRMPDAGWLSHIIQ